MGYAKHKKIFTDKREKNLTEHCINLVRQHHSLSMYKVKMPAYEFAEENQVPIPKNCSDNRNSGREWTWLFMKRHNLSLRFPKPTTLG